MPGSGEVNVHPVRANDLPCGGGAVQVTSGADARVTLAGVHTTLIRGNWIEMRALAESALWLTLPYTKILPETPGVWRHVSDVLPQLVTASFST
jgi:hypothetical protein